MSIWPRVPVCSSVPRPVAPKKPVAWHSSMKVDAPCRRASATISASGATVPSMEKTPSVTMSLMRASLAATSCASRSAMSRCL